MPENRESKITSKWVDNLVEREGNLVRLWEAVDLPEHEYDLVVNINDVNPGKSYEAFKAQFTIVVEVIFHQREQCAVRSTGQCHGFNFRKTEHWVSSPGDVQLPPT